MRQNPSEQKKTIVPIKSSGTGVRVSNLTLAKSKAPLVQEKPIVQKAKTEKATPKSEAQAATKNKNKSKVVTKEVEQPKKSKSVPPKKATPLKKAIKKKAETKSSSSSENSSSCSDEEEVIVKQRNTRSVTPAKKAPMKKTKELVSEEEIEEEVEIVKAKAPKAKVKQATKPANKKEIEVVEKKEATASKSVKVPAKKTTLQTSPISANKTEEVAQKTQPKKKTGFPVPNLEDINSLGKVNFNHPINPKLKTKSPLGIYEDYIQTEITSNTKSYINYERNFVCNNYSPLPIVCTRSHGIYIQDVDGKVFMDFLSAYSAINHGHNNEALIENCITQMRKLYMTSRAFYNDIQYKAAETLCKLMRYEKVLFMNSGVEAGESAVKIARRWGYDSKKIPDNEAKVVFVKGNFWGRSLYACATSDDKSRYNKFGPFDRSSHYLIQYNDIEELKTTLEKDPNICSVFLEPIQGENGVIIPNQGYLTEVFDLCKKHNVLMIVDEIQTGFGRTGYPLYCDSEGVKPDIILLGKSLSGGLYPVSAVLTSKAIMDLIKPGEHGSTYGGNPLASACVIGSISEFVSKNLFNNSFYRGIELGMCLRELNGNKLVKEVRGRGLFFGIELHEDCGLNAYDLSLWLMERGILCKPSRDHILRLSPPLSITTQEIERAADIILNVFKQAEHLVGNYQPQTATSFNILDTDQTTVNTFLQNRLQRRQILLMSKQDNQQSNHISEKVISEEIKFDESKVTENVDNTQSPFEKMQMKMNDYANENPFEVKFSDESLNISKVYSTNEEASPSQDTTNLDSENANK